MELDSALKDLSAMVSGNEKVLWFSKPDKLCFILESVFNPLLPFALIWGLIDLAVIFGATASKDKAALFFVVPFMLIHMMPVWIYLCGAILSILRYKNTAFIITTQGVYISGGTFTRTFSMKPFAELAHVSIHRGIFDQIIGVGDVIMSSVDAAFGPKNTHQMRALVICDIIDYKRVFKMVKELQTDIHADTMFPNALRPTENTGYNTEYKARREWFK